MEPWGTSQEILVLPRAENSLTKSLTLVNNIFHNELIKKDGMIYRVKGFRKIKENTDSKFTLAKGIRYHFII